MNPHVATLAFGIGILGLFALERDRTVRTSKALWIPTAWVLIASSRFVSQWISPGPASLTTRQQIEGSPLDRAILTGILLLGVIVLTCRGRRVIEVLRKNGPILLFFGYCAASVLWSDYPGVAFKRWIKTVGCVVMILVVLTDRERTAAVKRLLARVSFLLIPISILLIEYYPSLGREYSIRTGAFAYTGVTLNKNEFGMLCLIVGLASVWRLVYILRDRFHRSRRLVAHGAMLLTVLWLLIVANSATSLAAFLVGSAFIVLANLRGKVRPAHIHALAGVAVCAALFVVLFPEAHTSIIHALGRNTTLSGRTALWKALIDMKINPWLGTGFASFWMGNRLDQLWSIFSWQPNEAHNGYLGVYLNLGWVGVSLLAVLLATGYRNIVALIRRDPEMGSIMLGIFAVAVVYNLTEEAFRLMDPIWIFFLMAITKLPKLPGKREATVIEIAEGELSLDELQGVSTPYDKAAV